MLTRRPATMRWSGWATECLEYLSNSTLAHPSDPIFCHWARLTAITEEIVTSFSYDLSGTLADLSEIRVQFLLKGFEQRLEKWKEEIPSGDVDSSLSFPLP